MKIVCLFIALISLISCGDPTGKTFTDTPTSGNVNIVVEEGYTLLFQTQIYTFESLYTNAHVHVNYKTEPEALNDLMIDSAKVAVINRELTENEKAQFKSKNIYPVVTKIAEDAIALIVHIDNKDTMFSVAQLKNYLTGKDTAWMGAKKNAINIVFDNNNSANYRYMKELIGTANFQHNCFAVKGNPAVFDYVNTHKNALGIISVNWISDDDDTLSQSFLNKVKVVALTTDEVPTDVSIFRKPYQAYIMNKEYPLTRAVYMVNRQTRAGLGMGFVAFVAGEKGQRMIKLAGMIPATFPIRLIQLQK